jgi:hypothetical protein
MRTKHHFAAAAPMAAVEGFSDLHFGLHRSVLLHWIQLGARSTIHHWALCCLKTISFEGILFFYLSLAFIANDVSHSPLTLWR